MASEEAVLTRVPVTLSMRDIRQIAGKLDADASRVPPDAGRNMRNAAAAIRGMLSAFHDSDTINI